MKPLDLSETLGLPELPAYIAAVEQGLKRAVSTHNEYISKPLTRLLQVRGKRLRPALVLAAASRAGKKFDETVIAGGVAIELIHLASLIHDDIIDNADKRWNIPTINSDEGLASAIVVGDYVLACACREAARISTEAVQAVASAFAAICEGQGRELADDYNIKRTQTAYLEAVSGKTAALFAAACRIGGLCADLPEAKLEALTKYGKNFGMAFQLVDDVMDFVSSPELSGKPAGNDISEGVYTLPLLLALSGAQREELIKLLAKKQKADKAAIVEIILQSGSLQQTLSAARTYNHAAAVALASTETDLQTLPDTYLQWALHHLVAPEYQSNLT